MGGKKNRNQVLNQENVTSARNMELLMLKQLNGK